MNLKEMDFEEVRQHAISATTLASVVLSQVDEYSMYAPVAASVAFLFAATGYRSFFKATEDVVDALEDAGVIDEDTADKVNEVIDKAEDIVTDDDNE